MKDFFYTLIIYPLRLIIECVYVLCLKFFHNAPSNVGLSVVGVSAGVSLLCLPLYAVAERWQEVERETQGRLKPWADKIKKAFPKGDEQYMTLSTYYRQNGYHPLMALRSSFGLLIQIPFFMAAYSFLSRLPALRGASFLFIRDLGAPDALFSIGNFSVNVLPVAMTLINIAAGAVYTRGLAAREKAQVYGMAAVFLALLYNSPSGLALYWTMNNVFSLVKNVFYKLKNPLKKFWLCSCALCAAGVLYLFLVSDKKVYNNVLFTLAASLVFFAPLIARLLRRLDRKAFGELRGDRRLCLLIFALSLAALAILCGCAIPSFLISSSPAEFAALKMQKPLSGLLCESTLQAAGLFLFWPLCVYALFNRKGLRALFAFCAFCAAAFAFIDTFCFSGDYGDISTQLVFDNIRLLKPSARALALNAAALLAIVAAAVALAARKKSSYLLRAAVALALSASAVSVGNACVIARDLRSFAARSDGPQASEVKPVFHLSKTGRNVVVLMLDKAQSSLVRALFEESPDLCDVFTGFTLYDNTASFNGHTLIASPALFGGYDYTPAKMNARKDEMLVDKHNEALAVLPRVFSETAGYSVTLSDLSWVNYTDFPPDMSCFKKYPEMDAFSLYGKYTDLWFNEHHDSVTVGDSYSTLRRNFLFFSAFKCAPVALRRTIYQAGNWWSSDSSAEDMRMFINWYSLLDYFSRLTDTEAKSENTFTMLTNETPHKNLPLQAPDYVPVDRVTCAGSSRYSSAEPYPSFAGAMKRVAAWLEFLKANGVYDNSRIIIVADHGASVMSDLMAKDDALDKALASPRGFYSGRCHYHPMLFVKDFGATGRWKADETFMTNADVPALSLQGIVENPVNPFNGHPINMEEKKDGVLITTCDRHRAPEVVKENKYVFPIKDDEWWTVRDSIFDPRDWKRAEPPAQARPPTQMEVAR